MVRTRESPHSPTSMICTSETQKQGEEGGRTQERNRKPPRIELDPASSEGAARGGVKKPGFPGDPAPPRGREKDYQ